jgi:hypothetical protein
VRNRDVWEKFQLRVESRRQRLSVALRAPFFLLKLLRQTQVTEPGSDSWFGPHDLGCPIQVVSGGQKILQRKFASAAKRKLCAGTNLVNWYLVANVGIT